MSYLCSSHLDLLAPHHQNQESPLVLLVPVGRLLAAAAVDFGDCLAA